MPTGLIERLVQSRVTALAPRGISFPGSFAAYGGTSSANGWRNPTINAGLRLLAKSVAEPSFVGRRYRRNRNQVRQAASLLKARGFRNDAGAKHVDTHLIVNGFMEQVFEHPLVTLLNHPHVGMTGDELWGLTAVLDQWLSGNAYILKARTDLGNVAELWRLHPARTRPLFDSKGMTVAFEYRAGATVIQYPAKDIIHIKTLNPDDDRIGVPLLLSVIDAIDIDSDMKGYLKSFYRTGGSGPGAILTTESTLTDEDIAEIRERKRRIFGGPAGAHEWLILDNQKTTFQSLGLDRGLAAGLPKEVAAMVSAELSMALGIPGSILGQLIGYESSSYANKRQDWQVLWDITLTPLMEQLDNAINAAFLSPTNPEFAGIDEIYSDLSSIRALQEDDDAIQERHRKNVAAGLESWEEGRAAIGLDPNPPDGTYFLPTTARARTLERFAEEADAEPTEPPAPAIEPPPVAAVAIAAAFRDTFPQIEAPRPGRPRLVDDAGARALFEDAEAIRLRVPGLTLAQVAARAGISERTYREYRRTFSN